MNSQTAVERALRLVQPPPTGDMALTWRTTLNVLINDARLEFADQIHSSGDRELRSLLRKTFGNVTSNDEGYADLTPLVTDAEPLLVKHFNSSEIYLDGIARRVTLLPDESAVRLDRMAGFPFGALVDERLLLFNGGSPFSGDVEIRGPFAPTLDHIVGQLEEPFVIALFTLGTRQIPSATRTQAKDLKTVAAEGK